MLVLHILILECTQGHAGVLPEALRPKPGRLSHSQQRVYEVSSYYVSL